MCSNEASFMHSDAPGTVMKAHGCAQRGGSRRPEYCLHQVMVLFQIPPTHSTDRMTLASYAMQRNMTAVGNPMLTQLAMPATTGPHAFFAFGGDGPRIRIR